MLKITKDELHADKLRLTEPRSEIFAADENSGGVQCKEHKEIWMEGFFSAFSAFFAVKELAQTSTDD